MKKLVSVLLALLLVIGTQPSVGVQSGNKCRQIVDSVRIACSNLLVFVVYFLRKGSSPVSRLFFLIDICWCRSFFACKEAQSLLNYSFREQTINIVFWRIVWN